MWLLTALLLWVPACGQTHTAKSVITLQPPWVSVFPGESVTLRCEVPDLPWDNGTRWLLNGTAIETLTASYIITAASVNDIGEYRCQRGLSVPSDPVHLEVRRESRVGDLLRMVYPFPKWIPGTAVDGSCVASRNTVQEAGSSVCGFPRKCRVYERPCSAMVLDHDYGSPINPKEISLADWLLLQVSSRVVIEGKPLALRCHGWNNQKVYNVLFYHNNKTFQFSYRNSEFTIPKTNLSHNGIYHCTGNRHFTSAGVSVTVKELFPAPVLRASSSSPLLEGDPVNLSCETRVLPHSPLVQLYYSFYVANKTLVNRTTSSDYQILTANREDAGSYWCEAATEDGNVIKHSPELELQVLGLQSPTSVWFHGLFYLLMGIIFLVNTVLCVIIHKKLQRNKTWILEIPLDSDYGKKVTYR